VKGLTKIAIHEPNWKCREPLLAALGIRVAKGDWLAIVVNLIEYLLGDPN
jgi:hypothetical protein